MAGEIERPRLGLRLMSCFRRRSSIFTQTATRPTELRRGPLRAKDARREVRKETSGEADASSRALRVWWSQEEGSHECALTDREHPSCSRAGEAQLHSRGSGSAVGCGHHLREDLVGLALPLVRLGHLLPQGSWLVHGKQPQDRARTRCFER
jgi:hypothetical protein